MIRISTRTPCFDPPPACACVTSLPWIDPPRASACVTSPPWIQIGYARIRIQMSLFTTFYFEFGYEYGYYRIRMKTDISNSDSHSNTYSIYSWDSYVDGFIIDQIMLLHWIRKSWNPNYSYSYPLKMLIWISIFVFFFNIDVRWMYSNPFFNIILFNIIRIIRQKSDISDIIRIRIK
jgi:hypothetical protein